MALYVQEAYENADDEAVFSQSEVYETFTDDLGRLYRSLQREYGRCEGYIYVDRGSSAQKVGWVFLKRDKYSDTNETYLRRVWVTVYEKVGEQYRYASVARPIQTR